MTEGRGEREEGVGYRQDIDRVIANKSPDSPTVLAHTLRERDQEGPFDDFHNI